MNLQDAINSNGAFLVDVRTPGEFASGSAKGAVNIPLDRLTNEISQFKGKDTIVVFCASGGRSGMAQNILQQNGIFKAFNGGPWSYVATLQR
jgi:rhodanese-related sulfurtransferase